MGISLSRIRLNATGTLIILAAIGLASCSSGTEESGGRSSTPDQPPVVKADQAFVAAGSIEMRLSGGDYVIRAGADEHIRVSFGGNPGTAAASVTIDGTRATVSVTDTPRNNFRATVEVPATADLNIRLSGGNLEVGRIAGNKEIDSTAGNVTVLIANPNDYGTVDASVKAGDLQAGPFGESGSGIAPRVKWSGPGKHTLRASLGAGNLEFKR